MNTLLYGYCNENTSWNSKKMQIPHFLRCYYIFEGEIHYHTENEDFILPEKTLYILPSTTPCWITSTPQKHLETFWFHFNILPFKNTQLQAIEQPNHPFIDSFFQSLKEEYISYEQESSVFVSMLKTLELYLTRHFQFPEIHEPVLSFLIYIQKNLSDSSLSVANLSDHFQYSTRHFTRIFTDAIGTTPYDYIIEQRMYYGKSLLIAGSSVAEAAFLSGYSNPKVFSNYFKKVFHITPSEYCKQKEVHCI